MHIFITLSKCLFILLFFILVLVNNCTASSHTDTFLVKTNYIKPDESGQYSSFTWKFQLSRSFEGKIESLTCFPAEQPNEPFCNLQVHRGREGKAIGIEWESSADRKRTSETGTFLNPGDPAPCDIIEGGVSIQAPEKTNVKKRVGDRVFTEIYHVRKKTIETDEAVNNGWVDPAIGEVVDRFILVSVSDRGGELVLQQLWPVNDSGVTNSMVLWWVFEETPFRRSWRIMNPP